MTNKNYFKWMESVNIKNLHKFNNAINWFPTIEPTKEFSHSDAICKTKDDRKITVELKTRNGSLQDFIEFGTVFIEPKKMSHFTDVLESGFTLGENCLYINFTDDAVIVFDFSKPTKMEVFPNHRQWNPGKRKYEFETRFGWPIKDAIIYKYKEDGSLEKYKGV